MNKQTTPEYMVNDYKIGEGNMIGYMPTEFGKTGNNIVEKTIKAKSDVLKGRVVEIVGDFEIAHTSASSAKVIGVAMFNAEAGEPVSVETEGLFKLVAGGAITAGAQVTASAGGTVVVGTTNTIGIALHAAAKDDFVFIKFSI